jgi:hypothetical protein
MDTAGKQPYEKKYMPLSNEKQTNISAGYLLLLQLQPQDLDSSIYTERCGLLKRFLENERVLQKQQ